MDISLLLHLRYGYKMTIEYFKDVSNMLRMYRIRSSLYCIYYSYVILPFHIISVESTYNNLIGYSYIESWYNPAIGLIIL